LERVEKRVLVGLGRIARVDVEPELALAERADRYAVDLDVAHQEDLLMVLGNALGAAAQRLRRLLAAAEIAEIGCKAQLVVLADLLSAEHQHEMLGPGILDGVDLRLGERFGQIDPTNFSAAGRRERPHLDVENILHWRYLPDVVISLSYHRSHGGTNCVAALQLAVAERPCRASNNQNRFTGRTRR